MELLENCTGMLAFLLSVPSTHLLSKEQPTQPSTTNVDKIKIGFRMEIPVSGTTYQWIKKIRYVAFIFSICIGCTCTRLSLVTVSTRYLSKCCNAHDSNIWLTLSVVHKVQVTQFLQLNVVGLHVFDHIRKQHAKNTRGSTLYSE